MNAIKDIRTGKYYNGMENGKPYLTDTPREYKYVQAKKIVTRISKKRPEFCFRVVDV